MRGVSPRIVRLQMPHRHGDGPQRCLPRIDFWRGFSYGSAWATGNPNDLYLACLLTRRNRNSIIFPATLTSICGGKEPA